MIFLLGLIAVFYFFFIRPQAKKQKAQKLFTEEMQKGKQVVTTSGIIGTITKMDDQTVTLKVSDKAVLTILKSSISQELSLQYNDSKPSVVTKS